MAAKIKHCSMIFAVSFLSNGLGYIELSSKTLRRDLHNLNKDTTRF